MNLTNNLFVFIIINLIFLSISGQVYCAEGDVLWARLYDNGGGADYEYRISTDSRNNVIVFGSSWNGANYDFKLVKYDLNGVFLWEKSYGSILYEYGYGVDCDSNDNIIVTGWKGSWPISFDIYTIKYDPNGNVLWETNYNSGRNDRPYDLVIDYTNNILIVGSSNNGTNEDLIILKYDTNGKLLDNWPKIYNSSFNRDEEGFAITTDFNNNILVTGISNNGVDNDYLTIKYDKNGNLIWQKVYNIDGEDKAYGIATDYSNNSIVTGKTNGRFHTIKYNVNGDIIWERDFNVGLNDEIWDLDVDTYNNIFLVGEFTTSNKDFITIKYDQNGNLIWRKLYQNGMDDRAYSIAIDSMNDILIGGFTGIYGTNSVDFLTIKYEGILPLNKNHDLPIDKITKILESKSSGRKHKKLIEECKNDPKAQGCQV